MTQDNAVVADHAPRAGRRLSRTAKLVDQRVSELQRQYLRPSGPTPYSRAALARLRRGLGKPLGSVPEILDLVVDPGGLPPISEEPMAEEVAAATALTLYALHQQSQRVRMHLRGQPFGRAVGSLRLLPSGQDNEGVVRRFQALGTSASLDELVHHARGLVTLLRAAERGFDYATFTDDLTRFQDPRQRDAARLAWGRDFYRVVAPADERPTDPSESADPVPTTPEEQS